eukprot:2419410-Heterocapsa_arctica.AAC.1
MSVEELHHLCCEGQHQRLQERRVRDQQQHCTGALEGDEGGYAVQELDHPAEGRQVVRIHGKHVEHGAQGAEQIGG